MGSHFFLPLSREIWMSAASDRVVILLTRQCPSHNVTDIIITIATTKNDVVDNWDICSSGINGSNCSGKVIWRVQQKLNIAIKFLLNHLHMATLAAAAGDLSFLADLLFKLEPRHEVRRNEKISDRKTRQPREREPKESDRALPSRHTCSKKGFCVGKLTS
jgi:hypothetical protein